MSQIIVRTSSNLTLLGGGKTRPDELAEALSVAPCLVAADSGATFALRYGHVPQKVIGDMDSISDAVRKRLDAGSLHEIEDQESSDFDKALRSVSAPLVLGVGFLGRRVDHQLANFNVLVRRHTQPCILLGKRDIVLATPPRISLQLAPGTRVSLFPMSHVRGRSRGLHWSIDGLDLDPAGKIGTSNQVADTASCVELEFDTPGMLLILPRTALGATMAGLRQNN